MSHHACLPFSPRCVLPNTLRPRLVRAGPQPHVHLHAQKEHVLLTQRRHQPPGFPVKRPGFPVKREPLRTRRRSPAQPGLFLPDKAPDHAGPQGGPTQVGAHTSQTQLTSY
eukprot:37087-Prorocentrum_minimum.AAC.1